MDQVTTLTWRLPRSDAAVLERATLPQDDLEARLTRLRDHLGLPGLTYLATCQRVLWVLQGNDDAMASRLVDAYQRLVGIEMPAPESQVGFAAFSHVCEVASSLDALVPGEPQILGQVKAAVRRCRDAGLMTAPLDHFWQHVFRVAKRVRSETTLFTGKVSLVPLMETPMTEALAGCAPTAAVLGTGEMGRRTVERIKQICPQVRLHIVSRRLERAHEVAAGHGAEAHGLDTFLADSPATDLIVCAMDGGLVLSSAWLAATALQSPVTVIDLAMPRNTDRPEEAPHLRLIQMDDLNRISRQNLARRTAAMNDARRLLDDEADAVRREYEARCHASTMYQLAARFNDVAEARWRDAPDGADRKWFDQTVRALLHEAAQTLKEDR